jgi:hypothetical protein
VTLHNIIILLVRSVFNFSKTFRNIVISKDNPKTFYNIKMVRLDHPEPFYNIKMAILDNPKTFHNTRMVRQGHLKLFTIVE